MKQGKVGRLLERAARAVDVLIDGTPPPATLPPLTIDPHQTTETSDADAGLRAQVALWDECTMPGQDDLATWKRKSEEYFRLVESLLEQRDVWKKMFIEQGAQHQAAQAMLEREIMGLRQMLQRAVYMLNADRAAKGQPQIKGPDDLTAPPIGTAEAYGERMAALRAAAPEDIDGVAERDRIAGS